MGLTTCGFVGTGWSIRQSESNSGQNENLKAVIAPNEAAAAQYYPSIYWYSMMKIPDKSEFGGKGKFPRYDPE